METVEYAYRNFDLLFNVPGKASIEWYCKVYELGEKGDVEGVNKLFSQAKELYLDEYYIYNTIQQLTNDETFNDTNIKKNC